jgi:hypothetical protein
VLARRKSNDGWLPIDKCVFVSSVTSLLRSKPPRYELARGSGVNADALGALWDFPGNGKIPTHEQGFGGEH